MADSRTGYSPEAIRAAWQDPDFYAEPEDLRIAIMSDMDPAFAALPGIDKRRVMLNQERVYGRKRGPTAPQAQQSAPEAMPTGPSPDAMAQEAMYRSGLTPPSRAGAAPAAPPPEEVIRLGALLPNSGPSRPSPSADNGNMPPPVDSPFDETATIPTPIPATKPTGSILNVAKPGVYTTVLSPSEEAEFKQWVTQNKIPFDPGPQSTYDMRGYWRALKQRDQRTAAGDILNPPPDWQTPFHPDFSDKSIFAGSDAPKWMGDKLVDAFGRTLKDKAAEKAGQKALAQKNVDSFKKTPLQQYGEGPAPSPLDGPLAAGGPVGPGPVRPDMPKSWQDPGVQAKVAQPGAWPMVAETPPAEMFQYPGWENSPIIAGANAAGLGATGIVLNGGGGLAQAAGLDNLGQTMASAQNLLQEASAPKQAPTYDQVGDAVFSDPRWWAQTIGNGIGSMIPLMASGAGTASAIERLVGSGLIRGKLAENIVRFGPSAASGLTEGLTAGGSAYIQAKEAGATDAQALEAFAKVASTTAATSAAAFALGPMNDSLPMAAKVGISPFAEGTQEVLQGRGEDWGQRVYDPNHQYGAQDVENFVGGFAGGAMAAPADISAHRREKRLQPSPDMQQAFDDLQQQTQPPTAPPPQAPQQAPAPAPAPATPPQAEAPTVVPPPPPKRVGPRRPKPAAPAAPTIEDIPADIEAMLDEEEKNSPPQTTLNENQPQNQQVAPQPQPEAPAAEEKKPVRNLIRNNIGWDPETGEINPNLKSNLVVGEDGTTEAALHDAHVYIGKQQGLTDAEITSAELGGAFNEFDRQYLSTVAGPDTPMNPDAKGIYGAPKNPSGGLPDLSKYKQAKPQPSGNSGELPPAPIPAPGPVAESLSDLNQGAGAIVGNMYDALWKKVEAGDTTEGGAESGLLQVAKAIRERGGLQSIDDLKRMAKEYAAVTSSGPERQAELRKIVAAYAPGPREEVVQPEPVDAAAPVAEDGGKPIRASNNNERGFKVQGSIQPDGRVAKAKITPPSKFMETVDMDDPAVKNPFTLAFSREEWNRAEKKYGNRLAGIRELVRKTMSEFTSVDFAGPNGMIFERVADNAVDVFDKLFNGEQKAGTKPAAAPAAEEGPKVGSWVTFFDKKRGKQMPGVIRSINQDGKANVRFGTAQNEVEENDLPITELTGMSDVERDNHFTWIRHLNPMSDLLPENSVGESVPEPHKGVNNFIRGVVNHLIIGNPIKDTPYLNSMFKQATGLTIGDKVDQKYVYDAMEAGVAQAISKRTEYMTTPDVKGRIQWLKKLMSLLPTQTTRTDGQVAAQQFSTPPPLAYIAARAASIQKGNVVLEPSAGTGGLAAFAKAAGADVVTNEWDAGRRGLLELNGYKPFKENAEHIHAILPKDVHPDVVLMNPPFSSSVVRGGRNTNQTGYQHVIQAMKRLKPGGRLVAILGEGAKMGNPNAANFWKQMGEMGAIRADIGIDGREYAKYGTTFGNRLIVVDKHPAGGKLDATPAITGDYNTVEEAWDAIQRIADRNATPSGEPGEDPGRLSQDGERGSETGGSGPGLSGQPSGTGVGPASNSRPVRGPRRPAKSAGDGQRQGSQGTGSQPQEGVSGSGSPVASNPAVESNGGLTEEQAREKALQQLAAEAQRDIDEGEKALRDLGFYDSLGSTNLDPRAVPQLVKIGVGYAKKGYVSFKRWADAMLQQFSAVADKIRPHLRDIYDQAMEAYEQAVEALTSSLQQPSQAPQQPAAPQPEPPAAPAQSAESAAPAVAGELEDDGDFTIYQAKVPAEWGAKPHKAKIVETQSMAGVQAPPITKKPNIPFSLVEKGELSDVQMVSIARAAEAFQRFTPDGQRIAYFVGDGTGVGKGRQIAGTVLHLWNSGVRQILWVSYNETLINDAKRDLNDLGMGDIPVRWLGDINLKQDIRQKMPQGIVFAGYGTLASMAAEDKQKTDKGFVPFRRVRQLLNWFGEEPAIIFDEAHKAKNAGSVRGDRGTSKGTNSGKAVLSLQNERPRAYVLYSSATGFTEADNLIYAQRLGLWGKGTAFENFGRFRDSITKGGIGLMEILARDLKAQGLYESRFISYGKDENGVAVEFDEVEHKLTGEQREILNTANAAWRLVREKIDKAFEDTQSSNRKKADVNSRYYGSLLRFNMTMLTALKVPTLLSQIDDALNNKQRVIISVLMTNEAAQNRELERQKKEDLSLDDLDLSPARMLQELVDKAFPTQQYQEVYNPDTQAMDLVPVVDSEGNPVENPEAVAEKGALLEKLNELRLPDTAIDQIINKYGAANVAELTGRKQRVEMDAETGQRRIIERKGDDIVKAESELFQNGQKFIAIISPASSTGISLHASNRAKNKERRRHFVLQLMWSADQQMQVFGRSHRTDQATPPHYTLVTMDVGGEKRFASAIARRLEQLGALSRGDRSSSGAGSIANYNFESKYGHSAVNALLKEILQEEILGGKETIDMMGLQQLYSQDDPESKPVVNESEDIEVKKFFNRLQVLPIDLQNQVFDAFVNRMERRIEMAKEDGTYDQGAEKIKADEIEEEHPPIVVRTDPNTGAETYWYQIAAKHKRVSMGWDFVEKNLAVGYKLLKSPTGIVALKSPKVRTVTDETTGQLRNRHALTRANGEEISLTDEELKKWTPVEDGPGKEAWLEQKESAGAFRTEKRDLIGGSVLPIYDFFVQGDKPPKAVIANLKDGRRLLGIDVPHGMARKVLRDIGYGSKVDAAEMFSQLASGANAYTLARGIKISRTTIQGEPAIQFADTDSQIGSRLMTMGVQSVTQNYKKRYFIPIAGENAKQVLGEVLKTFPPTHDRGGAIEFGEGTRTGPRPVSEDRRANESGSLNADFLANFGRRIRGAARRGPVRVPSTFKPTFTWSSEEVEQRFQDGGKRQDEVRGIADRIKEFLESLKGLTRVYQHLPRKVYGRLIFELKQLEKAQGMASTRALIDMLGTIDGMSVDDFDLLRHAVIADDLLETMELFNEKKEAIPDELAFGFTPETLPAEHARVMEAVAQNPTVQAAMDHRRRVWDRVKAEYLDAMKTAGEDVSGKLQRKNYYRHRVLMVKRLEALVERENTIKVPNQRSHLKARKGRAMGMDYATNFIETEMAVMTQLMVDTRTAKFVAFLKEEFDLRRELQAEAKMRNVQTVMPYFNELAQMANDAAMAAGSEKRVTGDDVFRQTLNRPQAMAIETLGKLAANDALPDTKDGRWADVIDELASEYLARKADEEEGFIDTGGEIQGDLLAYAAWVLKQPEPGQASMAAGQLFKGIRAKQNTIKKLAGEKFVTWENLIPDTHEKMQVDATRAYYTVYTIPEKLALEAMKEGAEKIGISGDDIEKMLAVGAKPAPLVLPKEVVAQFKQLAFDAEKRKHEHAIKKGARAVVNEWKKWQLFGPHRVIKYLFRNQTGDMDSMLAGLPWKESVKHLKQAAGGYQKELVDYFWPILHNRIGDAKMTPELQKFADFGAFEGLLAVQEIGADSTTPDELMRLISWERKDPEKTLGQKLRGGPGAAYKGYMRRMEVINNWREAANRYAAYRIFLADIKANKGKPSSYSASIKEEVDALKTPEEKAYRMSNDLMGAYDEISVAGRVIREWGIPFWSYQELNFKRYARLLRNGIREGMTAEKVGRFAIGAAARAPYMAYTTGSTVLKAYALWSLVSALSMLFSGGDDDELRRDIRERPHLTFGKFGNETVYFPRIGNINDILEWMDFTEAQDTIRAAWEGRKPWDKALWDIIRGGPGEKLFLSAGPLVKIPFEAITGKTYYPDVRRPRNIESWPEKLAQEYGFGDAYKWMAGKPLRSVGPVGRVANLVIYRSDPKESAYYDTQELVRQWKSDHGDPPDDYNSNKAKTEAMRNMKRSLRYRDQAAFDKYFAQYMELGGTENGMKQSIRMMHPLYGLNKSQRADFIDSLPAEDKKRMDQALDYYEETFYGETAKDFFSIPIKKDAEK